MEDIFFGTSGPRSAEIMLVGEAWGVEEAAQHRPFVGSSGQELTRILSEAGVDRDKCFLSNVVPLRPTGNDMWRLFGVAQGAVTPAVRGLHPLEPVLSGLRALHSQIATIKPKIVIAVGNYALWALTNCCGYTAPPEAEGRRCPSGIESWRGSMWHTDALPAPVPMLPIIHPAAIMREWYKRPVTVHDLKERVPMALRGDWRPPPPSLFLAPPKAHEAVETLRLWKEMCTAGPLRVACDIETARGLITCIGFAIGHDAVISIPFVKPEGSKLLSYWAEEEEYAIVSAIRALLLHPNCIVEGQNFLYDTQYIAAFFGVIPRIGFDTMLAHHLLFPGTPKGLDYLSSLYCRYHWYWKDDGKEWDTKGTIETLLAYNALDCIRTFECATVLRQLIRDMGQEPQWEEELAKNALALKMMLRGVRIDQEHRKALALQLASVRTDYALWFERMYPQSLHATTSKVPWYDSSHQQKLIFAEDFGLRMPLHRKTGQPTFGKEALSTLRSRHPEFSRLFDALKEYRSLGVFYNTFVKAPLDYDGRMRCMFNTAGTESFRWSSSKNAFGRGTNLQNIPMGNEE